MGRKSLMIAPPSTIKRFRANEISLWDICLFYSHVYDSDM